MNVVLDRNRDAVQGTESLILPALPVRLPGLGQRAVAVHGNEGVQIAPLIDGIQGLGDKLLARLRAVGHQLLQPGNGRLRNGGGNRRMRPEADERQDACNAPNGMLSHDAPKLSSGGAKRNHQN